jgi:7 transmembrane receptor (rhodopsin family)
MNMKSPSPNKTLEFFYNVSIFSNAVFPGTNISIAGPTTATWGILPIFSLLILIFGCISNGILLFLFKRDPFLRTPFNTYLINLLIANLSCLIVQYPLDILVTVHSFRWFLGHGACTVYLYACGTLEGAVLNAHQLIAINRIWAVVHPISYRLHHSMRTATLLCVGMWVYVNLVMAPGLIRDSLYYRRPVETHGCLMNRAAQPVLALITSVIVFDWPWVVMLLALPIIYFTKKMRRKAANLHKNVVAPSSMNPLPYATTSKQQKPSEEVTEEAKKCQNTPDGVQIACASVMVYNVKSAVNQVTFKPGTVKSRRKSHGYLLLGLLVVSVAVCWTPYLIFYLLVPFMKIDAPTFYQVATILFSCQTLLDPILFTMAIGSLRDSLRRIVLCIRS